MLLSRPPVARPLPTLLSAALAFFDSAVDSNVDSDTDPDTDPEAEPAKPDGPAMPSSIDYLGHVRHLNMKKWAIDMNKIWSRDRLTLRFFQEYVKGTEFERQSPLDRFLTRNINDDDFLQRAHHDMLYREATWSLAHPILEQLQSLTIPLYDINRYRILIDRLMRLNSVRFLMDDLFDYPEMFDVMSDNDYMNQVRTRKETVFRSAVEFVKNHLRLFPDQLRNATFFDGRFWYYSQTCPETVQFEIFEILPPPVKITALTTPKIPQFMFHSLTMDVSNVDRVFLDPFPNNWPAKFRDCRLLLQRCRSLKILDIVVPVKGVFKWAVEEKRRMESFSISNISDSHQRQDPTSQDLCQPITLEHGLPPLCDVTLHERDIPFADEVNDVAFAFSQTLRRLIVHTTYRYTQQFTSYHFGRGWVDLPVLDQLWIDGNVARLVLDRDLLSHCPNVRRVDIRDRSMEYSCQELVPCSPARLDNIQYLTL
ncbi:hypothetical protein BGX33_010274 [Mortierella sp. NVP41]|nr:hypothetical protein BGX33_010274 [Mortierella sp. NVP41]